MEMGIKSNVSKPEMGTEKPFMLGSLYPLCNGSHSPPEEGNNNLEGAQIGDFVDNFVLNNTQFVGPSVSTVS